MLLLCFLQQILRSIYRDDIKRSERDMGGWEVGMSFIGKQGNIGLKVAST